MSGIVYRERNAGTRIDEHMRDEGFNIRIGVDPVTGFVRGGNEWNCGTWMDKMGSSERAGNRGQPATPRDGAPVELQALVVRVCDFAQDMHKNGYFPYASVTSADGKNGFVRKQLFIFRSTNILA
jgi:glycogen debranching enzyme